MKDKQQVILEAVRRAKKSQFGVTAIKVELEAQLDRSGSGWDEADCHAHLMQGLSDLGLAEYRNEDWHSLSHGVETQWYPVGALSYAEFYYDGSVDSEFTFTIMLDKEKNVLLLPKIIEIWNGLIREIGNEPDVSGAGMHMAYLCSRDGSYPNHGISDMQTKCLNNFGASMGLLIPALFFLGASNENARGTDFRRPEVGYDTHRAAIDMRHGALEFRVFDTCYDNPEIILDNFVVMSKCLRYWKPKRVQTGLGKITDRTTFGSDRGHNLDRFYLTHTHLDLLNEGLARLKPDYYTIRQVKEQRKFTKTKTKLNKERKEFAKQAEVEYTEYEERFAWSLKASRLRHIARQYESMSERPDLRQNVSEADIERIADENVRQEAVAKRSASRYLRDRLNEYERSLRGSHTLTA